MTGFGIGARVEKFTGDYHAEGEVRAAYDTPAGQRRYMVALTRITSGAIMHTLAPAQLRGLSNRLPHWTPPAAEARPFRITMTPGLPPDASPAAHIGRDAEGTLYLLRWDTLQACWAALGWERNDGRPWPTLRLARGENAGLIVGHVELPEVP